MLHIEAASRPTIPDCGYRRRGNSTRRILGDSTPARRWQRRLHRYTDECLARACGDHEDVESFLVAPPGFINLRAIRAVVGERRLNMGLAEMGQFLRHARYI